jgi:tetratricopeptide (TPR) repeat protein
MKTYLVVFLALGFYLSGSAQTVTELYVSGKYTELTALESQSSELTGDELYMIGFAFFQLENDDKAIEFYNKAIKKGFINAAVYFYKGLSLFFKKDYKDALKMIEIAIEKAPENQEYLNQKALIFLYQNQNDKALEIFEKATKLPNTYGEPFYWVAYIYHEKQDYQKALDLYYIAADSVPVSNSYHVSALESIGQLEYTFTYNYAKSAAAYEKAIKVQPGNYELYYKLMKSLNADKQYLKADSIFRVVQVAFNQGRLPKDEMEMKTVIIAQFEWNGQSATIIRSLVDPTETLDISYKVFLINKEGDAVERRFVVEKTLQLEKDGAKHLLCEEDKKTGNHITYPYGWSSDTIPLDDLERAVKLVLDGKMSMGASSNTKGK